MMKNIFLSIVLLIVAGVVHAQQPDSLQLSGDSLKMAVDSIRLTGRKKLKLDSTALAQTPKEFIETNTSLPRKRGFFHRFFVEKYPNPPAAALLGIIPGGGQIYNKKWWKLPIVYGAIGGMAWWAITTDQQYTKLRDNYKWVVDGDDNTNPFEEPYTLMSSNQLKGYRDIYRTYTEKRYMWMGITYLLSVTDAFVDAHLSRFDVSDDLSMQLKPVIQSGPQGFGPAFGIGISLGFNSKRNDEMRIPRPIEVFPRP
ncbi:MAG: hypothetical protein JNJ57_01385 [Saprospiraceae bacterium]|nr:hypothetical protein [Saprospiraceae bacterium]